MELTHEQDFQLVENSHAQVIGIQVFTASAAEAGKYSASVQDDSETGRDINQGGPKQDIAAFQLVWEASASVILTCDPLRAGNQALP